MVWRLSFTSGCQDRGAEPMESHQTEESGAPHLVVRSAVARVDVAALHVQQVVQRHHQPHVGDDLRPQQGSRRGKCHYVEC